MRSLCTYHPRLSFDLFSPFLLKYKSGFKLTLSFLVLLRCFMVLTIQISKRYSENIKKVDCALTSKIDFASDFLVHFYLLKTCLMVSDKNTLLHYIWNI